MDKIICVGKNYLEHARELGDAVPELPVLFLKPPSAMIQLSSTSSLQASLPLGRGSIHHECEIVARIQVQNGVAKIDAVTLGLDMTLRDVQAKLKKNGHPWEVAKVFAGSAIVGPWISVKEFPNWLETEFSFKIDGQIKQKGRGTEMRLSPDECVRYAAEHFPLCSGDAVFTGTPAGVGPVSSGQVGILQWSDRLHYEVRWT